MLRSLFKNQNPNVIMMMAVNENVEISYFEIIMLNSITIIQCMNDRFLTFSV